MILSMDWKDIAGILHGYPRDKEPLVARFLTGNYTDSGLGEFEHLREKFDTEPVGCIFYRRCGDADLQFIPLNPADFGSGCTRLKMEAYRYPFGRFRYQPTR